MKKAIILARVSTLRQEKEGLSLKEIQVPALKQYAKDHDLEIVEEFIFSETADRKIRKKFDEVVDFFTSNKDVKVIISYRVDRVTRNFRDAVLFDDLRLNHDKELHFVHDRLVLTKNSYGRDIQDWDTKIYLAKQQLNRLKDDGKTTWIRKLEQGEWPAKAPFGYKNVVIDGKKWIEPDEYEKIIVRKIYEWYSVAGHSMNTIKDMVKKEYALPKFSKGMVDKILKNKFCIGIMEAESFPNRQFPHKYERIISKETFEKVQEVKASYNKRNSKTAYNKTKSMYQGLIRCAVCGCAITPEPIKKNMYKYYRCTQYHYKHDAKYIEEKELTKQFSNLFKQMTIPDEVLKDLVQTLKEAHQDKNKYHNQLDAQLMKQLKKYDNRISKMYDDKLDGSITETIYAEKYQHYTEQKQR